MLRFDFEAKLESHALGRSLLFLVRDGDGRLDNVSRHTQIIAPPNPFDAVRARLATIDRAICSLHTQVQLIVGFCCACDLDRNNTMALHKMTALSNRL